MKAALPRLVRKGYAFPKGGSKELAAKLSLAAMVGRSRLKGRAFPQLMRPSRRTTKAALTAQRQN